MKVSLIVDIIIILKITNIFVIIFIIVDRLSVTTINVKLKRNEIF